MLEHRDATDLLQRMGRLAAKEGARRPKPPDPPTERAANDADKTAQEARASKYGIGVKDGGNVTKPGEWKDVPDAEWGDPTNYKLPMPDKEHADNAAARFAQDATRTQYSSEEQGIIDRRITARQKSFGEAPDKKEDAMDDDVQTADVGTDAPIASIYGPADVGTYTAPVASSVTFGITGTPTVTIDAAPAEAAPPPDVADAAPAPAPPAEPPAQEPPTGTAPEPPDQGSPDPVDLLERAVALVQRAGKAISATNGDRLKAAHDHIAGVMGMECAVGQSNQEDPDNDGDLDTPPPAVQHAAPDVDPASLRRELVAMQTELATTRAAHEHIMADLTAQTQQAKLDRDLMRADADRFRTALTRAESVGMGRPTERAPRDLDPAQMTYEDRLALAAGGDPVPSPYAGA